MKSIKKLLSIFFASMLLVSMFPLHSFADSSDTDYETLMDLASSAFPEYAYRIQHPVKSNFASPCSAPVIVHTEARKANETTCVILSEYDDGSLFLLSAEGEGLSVLDLDDIDKEPNTEVINNSITASTTGKTYDVTIIGSHPGVSGTFKLSNFRYLLNELSHDRIVSTGTTSNTGYCTGYERVACRLTETSSSRACLAYTIGFQFGPGGYYTRQTELWIYVGHDTMTISHTNKF